MLLNEIEKDALAELINIGFGTAARSISILAGQRVLLETPQVDILPLENMAKALQMLSNRDLFTVHQIFSGKISGDMMLLLDIDSGTSLVNLLLDGFNGPLSESPEGQEALSETGNIILNGFCGSFSDLLKIKVSFNVPNLRLESLQQMLDTFVVDEDEIHYAVVVKIRFRLSQNTVSGYIIIVMGLQSLEGLLEAMRAEGFIVK